ncbi:MAG: EI24 domain-containing protein [Rhodospirillales bacterium]
MFSGLFKAVEQLGDPRLRRVIVLSLLASLGALVLLVLGISATLHYVQLISLGWLDTIVSWLIGAGSVVLAFFLFPVVVGIVISLFLDEVADAVEARHYPELPKAPGLGFWAGLWTGIRFAGLLLAVNIALLFVWAIMLLTVVLAPFVPLMFYVVNGWLVGREYFEQIAFRRMSQQEARELRRPYGLRLTLAGTAIAFLATIPIVNLIVAVLGTAYMVHVVQDLTRRRDQRGDRAIMAKSRLPQV